MDKRDMECTIQFEFLSSNSVEWTEGIAHALLTTLQASLYEVMCKVIDATRRGYMDSGRDTIAGLLGGNIVRLSWNVSPVDDDDDDDDDDDEDPQESIERWIFLQ